MLMVHTPKQQSEKERNEILIPFEHVETSDMGAKPDFDPNQLRQTFPSNYTN